MRSGIVALAVVFLVALPTYAAGPIGTWELVAVNGVTTLEPRETIEIGEAEVSARLECNWYALPYKIEDGLLKADWPTNWTQTVCERGAKYPPERVLVFDAMGRSHLTLEEGTLVLGYTDRRNNPVLLKFLRAPQ